MKKNPLFAVLFIILIGSSCKKDENSNPPASVPYMSNTAGSIWQYRLVNNRNTTTTPYSLTSTARDTPINSRNYHVFTNSNGNTSEYYLIAGSEYYNFRALGASLGNSKVEVLYLKDNLNAGDTWAQSQTLPTTPIPLPVTLTFTVVEKGISRIVNGITYSDVIHIKTVITSSLIPPTGLSSDIHNYYAPRVGVIETTNKINVNFSGITDTTDTKTILLSATIL